MKQYCKYCAHAYQIDIDLCWCEKRNTEMTDKQASRVNTCKNFELNPISVFDLEKTYKPRTHTTKKQKNDDGKQMRML